MKNRYPQPAVETGVVKKCFTSVVALLLCLCLFAQPTITSFTPTSGPAGTTVSITGANFSAVTTDNSVFFGAAKATVTAATTTTLTVIVPGGTTREPITVTTNYLTAFSLQPFNITHAGTGAIDANAFETGNLILAGYDPSSVASGDFDGDGKPDVAITRLSGNKVTVLRNTSVSGSIQLATRVDYDAGGTEPRAVTIGDVNGDGKPDMVVANQFSDNLTVFRNTSTPGNISFDGGIWYGVMHGPAFVMIRDMNGDGKPELVTGNMRCGWITVLRNGGSGGSISFGSKTNFNVNTGPGHIDIRDMDGDSKPDVVAINKDLSNSSAKDFSVLRNTGTAGAISFAPAVTIVTARTCDDLITDDLDGDDRPDVAVLMPSGNTLSLYRNTSTSGNIAFAPPVDYTIAANATELAADDLDGDGRQDLAVGFSGSTNFSVFKNTSSAGAISLATSINYTTSYPFHHLCLSDMDMDGKPDVIGADGSHSQFSIFRNIIHEPVITSFTPTTVATGSTVTITGSYFTGASAVTFGGVPATSFTVVDDNTMTAVVGAGAYGAVAVTTPGGTGRRHSIYYINPPTISTFTPATGFTGGTVTINGTYFTNASVVTFGGIPAASFTVSTNGNRITAVVGSGATGDVSVTTPGGTATKTGFTYNPPPVITSFTPTTAGYGQQVVISGSGFTGATSVAFGGIAAVTYYVASATTIYASPGWNGASGNVTVTTPTRGTGSMAGFTYIDRPGLSSITPNAAGTGQTVTITGTRFTGITAVSFSGVPVASFTVVSPTTITAVVGTGATGSLWVTGPGGTTIGLSFTFVPAPVITSFTPTTATIGETVTITGTDFTGATAVSFGGTPATSFTVASATTITAIVAAGTTGDVSVTTTGGTATSTGFTYIPPPPPAIPSPVITSFTPSTAGKGQTITITGTDFTGATAVSFGGTAAASFTVVSPVTITAVLDTGTTGDIAVTTPGGTATAPGFIYLLPASGDMKVYPNPARDHIWVTHPASVNITQLKVMDAAGKVIKTVIVGVGVSLTKLDLHGVTPGYYRIIRAGSGRILNEGIIVQ